MQQISLDLDKENELIFKISIEGTKPASSRSRFLLESQDYTLVFPTTKFSNGQVSVIVPTLEKVLEEGIYSGTLEVIVDDRIFEPIKLDAEFKKSLKVVAEAVVRKKEKTVVSAEPVVVVNRPDPVPIVEKIKEEPIQEKIVETVIEYAKPEPSPPKPPPKRSASDISLKPAQRNRTRPKTLKESRSSGSKSTRPKRVSAEDVRKKISEKHGVQLTESQVSKVISLYRLSKKRKSKK
jgi:hypothetical protein